MPNWTSNVIRFGGDKHQLQRIKDALCGDQDGHAVNFDFNRLTPMPNELEAAEESSLVNYGKAIVENDILLFEKMISYPWIAKENARTAEEVKNLLLSMFPECVNLYQLHQSNLKSHGHSSWLGWARENWGTKWNACNVSDWSEGSIRDYAATYNRNQRDVDGNEILMHYCQLSFNSAWCVPMPIINKLEKLAEELGITFDHWFSDEDGGSRFDPKKNERITIWEHHIKSEIVWE